ncbi:MAG: TRAP transporter substrate-binding protein DctP [Hyphomicrobiaceae bacterium]
MLGKLFARPAMAAGLLSLLAGVVCAQPVELKIGDFQSTQHIQSREGTQLFMREVEKRTAGKIKFSHFPNEQAAKAKGLLDAAKSGVLDIAVAGILYSSERLPLASIVGLPGFGDTALEGTKALLPLVTKGVLRAEFEAEGVVPIYAYVLTPYQILLKSKSVGDPKDWAGLKVRTGGTTQALTVRAFGASGINLAGPEVYTAVERGTVDGVLFPIPSVPGYNLQEVVKYISDNGSFGNFGMAVVMNKAAFDKLTEDQRKAVLEAGHAAALNVAKAQDDSTAELLKEWKAKGITIFSFTPAQQKAYTDAMKAVGEEWVSRIGKKLPQAKDIYAAYEKAVVEARK